MSIVTWLNHKFPIGLYRGPIKRCLAWCDQTLSLNTRVKIRVHRELGVIDDTKSPEWISEVYQFASLVVAIALLIAACYAPRPIAYIAASLALYRPFEITVFAVNWVFVHLPHVLSHNRSLAGFVTNIAEVVVFYATAYLGFGCISCPRSI